MYSSLDCTWRVPLMYGAGHCECLLRKYEDTVFRVFVAAHPRVVPGVVGACVFASAECVWELCLRYDHYVWLMFGKCRLHVFLIGAKASTVKCPYS